MSGALRFTAMTLACLSFTGCFLHKQKAVVPVVAQTPVPIEKAPELKTPPVIAQVPLTPVPLPAVKIPEKKPKKPRKKVVAPETPAAPMQVASAGPVPDPGAVIGALTVGGDEAPEKKRQASDLLADLEKRLNGLGAGMLDRQKEGIARVRYFEREAKTALDAGDVQGAMTLVTKAKVLLDDLVK